MFFGWRYQSNANLGPTSSNVRLFGQSANLNQSSVGSPDWGLVASGQIRHTYDLGLQDKSALESQLTFYANRQFTQSSANVSLVDLTSGQKHLQLASKSGVRSEKTGHHAITPGRPNAR